MNNEKSHKSISYNEASEILASYPSLKRKLLQLQFEIENIDQLITEADILDSMAFSQMNGERTTGGQLSDKTGSMALSYSENLDSMRLKTKAELEAELAKTALLLERIEYYIQILPPKSSDVLRLLFLENKTYTETAEALGVSVDTVKSKRKKGISEVAVMFSRLIR